mmetsp:Transcript_9520/g.30378  ORF Transcript_9520/g.30378 Transcript_9520/m.30378 type:complete len:274 (+) Transcript_9520:180-1001(+)
MPMRRRSTSLTNKPAAPEKTAKRAVRESDSLTDRSCSSTTRSPRSHTSGVAPLPRSGIPSPASRTASPHRTAFPRGRTVTRWRQMVRTRTAGLSALCHACSFTTRDRPASPDREKRGDRSSRAATSRRTSTPPTPRSRTVSPGRLPGGSFPVRTKKPPGRGIGMSTGAHPPSCSRLHCTRTVCVGPPPLATPPRPPPPARKPARSASSSRLYLRRVCGSDSTEKASLTFSNRCCACDFAAAPVCLSGCHRSASRRYDRLISSGLAPRGTFKVA